MIKITHPNAPCNICKGEGFNYVPSKRGRHISFLEICVCVESKCKCDKSYPYIYIDEETSDIRKCYCYASRLKVRTITKLMNKSKIPVKYRYRRLFEFQINKADKDQELQQLEALSHAEDMVAQYSEIEVQPVSGIFLYGAPGTGKTMLACLVLNELILRHQIEVRYMKITRDFFNSLKDTYNIESNQYGRGESLFKRISEIEVLVIDDFGVQSDSDWEQRTLYDLIDARYESEKPTIITSNLPPKNIESTFKNRIYSRLKEMTVFQELTSLDFRDNFQ